MGDKNGMDLYGLGVLLEHLRPAASRALELHIEAIDDQRITAARRLINAQNLLNLWLRTETLNHQRLRITERLDKPEATSQQPAVFQLHQTGANNHETN